MKVSIITVCYNNEATIKDTIDSVVNQDYPNIEYVVVDGQSTDRTLEIIKSYGDQISVLISEKDNGLYDAINKGIEVATGDIIGLIHADDVIALPIAITTIVNQFSAVNCEATYSDLQYVNQADLTKVTRTWLSGEYADGLFLKGWMPPHPTLYARREVFKKYGAYNTSFVFSADYELMLRIIHKGKIRMSYIPQVLVKMRVGGKSNASLKNRIKANLEDRRAWKVNGIKPGVFTLFQKPLSKLGQFFS